MRIDLKDGADEKQEEFAPSEKPAASLLGPSPTALGSADSAPLDATLKGVLVSRSRPNPEGGADEKQEEFEDAEQVHRHQLRALRRWRHRLPVQRLAPLVEPQR